MLSSNTKLLLAAGTVLLILYLGVSEQHRAPAEKRSTHSILAEDMLYNDAAVHPNLETTLGQTVERPAPPPVTPLVHPPANPSPERLPLQERKEEGLLRPPVTRRKHEACAAPSGAHDTVVASAILNPDQVSVTAAAKLLRSLRRNTPRNAAPFLPVLLEVAEDPIPEEQRSLLRKAGWSFCTVHQWDPYPRTPTTNSRDYTMLALWGMPNVKTLVFIGLHWYVTGDLSRLLIGPDVVPQGNVVASLPSPMYSGFDTGLFTARLDEGIYKELVAYYTEEKVVKFNRVRSLSGFLNAVMKRRWAPLSNYDVFPAVRYEGAKLWECDYSDPEKVLEACRWWRQEVSPAILAGCVNKPVVTRRTVVFSPAGAPDDMDAMLGKLRLKAQKDFEAVALSTRKFSQEKEEQLRSAGWIPCQLPLTPGPLLPLWIWGMEKAVDAALYLPSAAMAEDGARLLQHPLPKGKPYVLLDGALLLRPCTDAHQRLSKKKKSTLEAVLKAVWPEEDGAWQPPVNKGGKKKKAKLSDHVLGCSNEVQRPHGAEVAVVSSFGSTQSSVKQLEAIRRHTKVGFAPFLLDLPDSPVPPSVRKALVSAGWLICTVDTTPPLAIRRLRGFRNVLYLAPEVYPVASLTWLLTEPPRNDGQIGVVRPHKSLKTLHSNSVFFVQPDSPAAPVVDPSKSRDLGPEYGFDIVMAHSRPERFPSLPPWAKLVRFSFVRPWKKQCGTEPDNIKKICKLWK